MYQNQNNTSLDDPLRVATWRALVERHGGVMPVPAPVAFTDVTGRSVRPTAITRRRNADNLPWPRASEINDGQRKLVPLHVIVDCILGKSADAPRRVRHPRGRPRKTAPTAPTAQAEG